MSKPTPERTAFLIDGFNLYHSIKQAQHDLARLGHSPPSMKWLNLRALCQSYIHLIGRTAVLSDVFYFSALATHLQARKPDVIVRHQTLIEALKSTGVIVELSRFKEKRLWCDKCNSELIRHEEKETDVAISLKLIELFLTDACDTAVFITGDTDVAPAIRTAKRLFPQKRVAIVFPYARRNLELANLADNAFRMKREQYANDQFPSPLTLPDGRVLMKPASW